MNHPHRGSRGQARKRWEAAASAASLLYRSLEARTGTEEAALLGKAARALSCAGLVDLAARTLAIACDFGTPDAAVRALLDRVAEEAGKLEATYLQMTAHAKPVSDAQWRHL